jgi:hypothetical protein
VIHGREVLPPAKPNAERKKMPLVPLLQKEPKSTKLAAKLQKKTQTMPELTKQINNQHCAIGKKKDNSDSDEDDDKVDDDSFVLFTVKHHGTLTRELTLELLSKSMGPKEMFQ